MKSDSVWGDVLKEIPVVKYYEVLSKKGIIGGFTYGAIVITFEKEKNMDVAEVLRMCINDGNY